MIHGITRVISFTGGKGGTGKTTVVVNVAIALARLGRSVLVLDADLGLANVDIMLGLTPKYTLADVQSGTRKIEDTILYGPEGIAVIPAASGVPALLTLDSADRTALLAEVERVAAEYDYLLIDTPAGIGPEVMAFATAAHEIISVVTPEPTSLTDTYALMKILSSNYGEKSMSVIFNNVRVPAEGLSSPGRLPFPADASSAWKRLSSAVQRHLFCEMTAIGWIPSDVNPPAAVRQQRALLELYPSSAAARAIANVAQRIDENYRPYEATGRKEMFFERIVGLSHGV